MWGGGLVGGSFRILIGFNIGFNLGKAAGAGIPKHLHCHVVPRWEGDHNFMPVISNTRVLPESIDEMWKQLKKYC